MRGHASTPGPVRVAYAASIFLAVAVLTQLLNALVLSGRADPARQLLGQRAEESALHQVRRELGLHLSPALRILRALNDLSPLSLHKKDSESAFAFDPARHTGWYADAGSWRIALKWPYVGYSYQNGEPVHRLLFRAIPATVVLAVTALLIGLFWGILLGFWAALKHGKITDAALSSIASLGVAVPSFLVALLAQFLFAFRWGHYTGLPLMGSLIVPNADGAGVQWALQNLVLPAFVLGIRPMASILNVVRTAVLETLSAEYVKTACAKGLSSQRVYLRHVLPNALMPVVSLAGNWLAGLMGGAVFVEYVFGWNGVGKLLVEALENRDFNIVSGILLYMAFMFLLIHYATEWVYGLLNPELRRN